MSGKGNSLQWRIRILLSFNIYINCLSHRLVLCLPLLMKNIEYTELLLDYNAVLLGMQKMFHYSPRKGAMMESVQKNYGKKPPKMLKVAVT